MSSNFKEAYLSILTSFSSDSWHMSHFYRNYFHGDAVKGKTNTDLAYNTRIQQQSNLVQKSVCKGKFMIIPKKQHLLVYIRKQS